MSLKEFFLLFPSLLSGVIASSSFTIEGRLALQERAKGQVILGRLTSDPQPKKQAQYRILSQASLSSTGKFLLLAPQSIPADWPSYPITNWACGKGIRISDPEAKFSSAGLYLDMVNGGGTIVHTTQHSKIDQILYWFLTKETTIIGQCGNDKFALLLKKGWNSVRQTELNNGILWSAEKRYFRPFTVQFFGGIEHK
ncbi:hypothetical protein [Deinococcus hopiensis]|uniref:Uncharacterized protein n=1 Tax=Deinococcus hopiensis KR-140 TaxID=695939 RepID=A0A1W1USA5_9DEIO|nr:hypothetical protein [Deinococcus hopiensis]SMB83977.1 hypothetical protein SAMN00790413_04954 [Deinococcus hopiensis KR-140]